MIEQDACFLTLCDRSFNKKQAYAFLEDLSQEFYNQYGSRINTATRPYSFIEFGKANFHVMYKRIHILSAYLVFQTHIPIITYVEMTNNRTSSHFR